MRKNRVYTFLYNNNYVLPCFCFPPRLHIPSKVILLGFSPGFHLYNSWNTIFTGNVAENVLFLVQEAKLYNAAHPTLDSHVIHEAVSPARGHVLTHQYESVTSTGTQ
jgi:hypothetical protein